ncbi:MAG: sigma factor-like helix-turn-helix DNA-binding protein [Rhodothermales bacterium]
MHSKSTILSPWNESVRGNRGRFNQVFAPHLPELLQAGRREIAYRQKRHDLHPGEVSADELAGETLIRAWHDRAKCPEHVSLRTWLLGTQHRVLEQLTRRAPRDRDLWAVSLGNSAPHDPIADELTEGFWEWSRPDSWEGWEDVLADDAPTQEEVLLFGEEETHQLEPAVRQILVMHDRHRLPKSEVASAMQIHPKEVKTILREARRKIAASR